MEEGKPAETNLSSLRKTRAWKDSRAWMRAEGRHSRQVSGRGPGRTTLVSQGLGSATPGRWAAVRPQHGAVPSLPPEDASRPPPAPMAPLPPRADDALPRLPGAGTASRPQAPAGLRGLSVDLPQQRWELGPSLPRLSSAIVCQGQRVRGHRTRSARGNALPEDTCVRFAHDHGLRRYLTRCHTSCHWLRPCPGATGDARRQTRNSNGSRGDCRIRQRPGESFLRKVLNGVGTNKPSQRQASHTSSC